MQFSGGRFFNLQLATVNLSPGILIPRWEWNLMFVFVFRGCAHTCSLCLASCENIIEYGKHLNDDRHKHALSRRNKDPNIPDVLDSFG